jgi:AcrR family transcriptional regulator
LSLSAEAIYEAALRLVDLEGIDALTMRRLAGELGVATMSLYGHVPGKDHLLLGVVNLATSEIRLPDPETPPWEALKAVTREFRRVSLLHPNLVPLIVRQPPTGSDALYTLNAALDALRRAGFAPDEAVRAYRVMASFAIGFVSLECGGFFEPVDVRAGSDVAPVDLAAVPRVMECGPYLADWDAAAEFEAGMDRIIAALTTTMATPSEG